MLIPPDDLAVHLVKAALFIFRFGKRFDHAHARHVLLHLAYHGIHRRLHLHIQRHAPARYAEHHHPKQRQRCDKHKREHGLKRKRDDDAAEQQDRRAHAKALHAVYHLMHIVRVACKA